LLKFKACSSFYTRPEQSGLSTEPYYFFGQYRVHTESGVDERKEEYKKKEKRREVMEVGRKVNLKRKYNWIKRRSNQGSVMCLLSIMNQ